MAERLVSSKREHGYSSAGSWSHMADGWKWRFSLEILCNFMDKMLEGELPDEELCQFLVVVDFM